MLPTMVAIMAAIMTMRNGIFFVFYMKNNTSISTSKCAQGMDKQILKTSGADVLSSRKKLRKTLGQVASTPSPPLYIQGLIELCSENCIKQN